MNFQTIIVLIAVALAGFWLARYLVRSFLRKGPVGCGSCCGRESEKLPVHPDQT
jgi:hypothetical protein